MHITQNIISILLEPDSINIKILNAGAWARSADRVMVTLPRELEDYIPQVEEFYRVKHSGRKLQWHHHMSNGIVSINFFSTDYNKSAQIVEYIPSQSVLLNCIFTAQL